MPVTSDTSAPYTPLGQILEIVNRYRERGNPTVFNHETLGRVGVPDSLSHRTLQALRTLDLINESGEPTETFETIRLAPSDNYQKVLQEWLQAVYADVFSLVDANDDETRIRDAFRTYTPTGQQGRMVSLFLGLCEEAGLRQKAEKRDSSDKTRRRTTTPRTSSTQRQRKTQPKQKQNNPKFDTGLPVALTGLLSSLPDPSMGWTQAERDKFINTFGAVLDFCYPIVTAEELQGADMPEDEAGNNED